MHVNIYNYIILDISNRSFLQSKVFCPKLFNWRITALLTKNSQSTMHCTCPLIFCPISIDITGGYIVQRRILKCNSSDKIITPSLLNNLHFYSLFFDEMFIVMFYNIIFLKSSSLLISWSIYEQCFDLLTH